MTWIEIIIGAITFTSFTFVFLCSVDGLLVYLDELEEKRQEKAKRMAKSIEKELMKKLCVRTGRFLLPNGEVDSQACQEYLQEEDLKKFKSEKRRQKLKVTDIDFEVCG